MRDYLGVGFGAETATARLQGPTQLEIVFDDAVVNDDDTAGAMRVRILFGRATMRCPARVSDANRAGDRILTQKVFEVRELADRAPDDDLPVMERGDTGRIVTAILQTLQPL